MKIYLCLYSSYIYKFQFHIDDHLLKLETKHNTLRILKLLLEFKVTIKLFIGFWKNHNAKFVKYLKQNNKNSKTHIVTLYRSMQVRAKAVHEGKYQSYINKENIVEMQ